MGVRGIEHSFGIVGAVATFFDTDFFHALVEPSSAAGDLLCAVIEADPALAGEMLRRLRDLPAKLHTLAEESSAANFLRAVLEADPTLAEVTEGDPKGRTPIEHACPECRRAMRAALCLLGRFKVDDGPPLHFSATSAVVQVDDLGSTDKTSGADAKPPRRALKAMRKAEQVLAVLNGRDGLDPKYYVARSNTNTRSNTIAPRCTGDDISRSLALPNITPDPTLTTGT